MNENDLEPASGGATHACALGDRGVVRVSGDDAETFLQGIVTNDVTNLPPSTGRYAALLTPQGKILFDFLVVADPSGGFWLDCPRTAAADLAKRLGFYKLRAKVAVEDRSAALAVVAIWGVEAERIAAAVRDAADGVAFTDPRQPELGWRIVAAADRLGLDIVKTADEMLYESHRIGLAVPRSGVDFAYADSFPHEANLDRLHGVDFKKGCYVGQEVVSRVEHRGLARRRVVAVRFDGSPPSVGTAVFAGDVELGIMGSGEAGRGLAMLRLDRVAAAAMAGTPIVAGAVPLRVTPAE